MSTQPADFTPSADIKEAVDRLGVLANALNNAARLEAMWCSFRLIVEELASTQEDVDRVDALSKAISEAISQWSLRAKSVLAVLEAEVERK